MAHLKTKETHNKPEERKTWRYHLTTMLYDQGYDEQAIIELHSFLDWIMDLPEEFEKQFQPELKTFEEARQMKYVTTIERMAEARGAKSREVEIALNLLSQGLAIDSIAQATGLTSMEIKALQNPQK